MAAIEVNKNNFVSEVIDCDKTVLVDFWAPWCAPCRMVSPIIDEIANENPEIKVCKVNVEKEGELAEQFKIISIPTIMVIKNGQVVNQSVGVIPKNKILELL